MVVVINMYYASIKIRTYSELIRFSSFEERFQYLSLLGSVGEKTFGFDRYINQLFYRNPIWKSIRNDIIIRDNGCDMGLEDYEVNGSIYIHHINPISKEDIIHNTEHLLNPEFLITTSFRTHNAIHYGNIDMLSTKPVSRTKNDTCPWKK